MMIAYHMGVTRDPPAAPEDAPPVIMISLARRERKSACTPVSPGSSPRSMMRRASQLRGREYALQIVTLACASLRRQFQVVRRAEDVV